MSSYDQTALVERLEFGLRLRNWSARELGRRADLSESTITQFMRRARDPEVASALSLPTVYAIAYALDLSFGWLVTGEGSPHGHRDARPPAARAEVNRTHNTEGGTMAAYLQGALLAGAAEVVKSVTQPASVRQAFDGDGYYEPHFLVTLASGIVLRVTVTVESEP